MNLLSRAKRRARAVLGMSNTSRVDGVQARQYFAPEEIDAISEIFFRDGTGSDPHWEPLRHAHMKLPDWFRHGLDPLSEAYAAPIPAPAPRISIAGETPAGARLAARAGDAWVTFEPYFDRLLPIYLEALAAAGRRRSDVSIIVGHDVPRGDAAATSPILADLVGTAAAWRDRGADELVLHWIHADHLDAVLPAGERAWA